MGVVSCPEIEKSRRMLMKRTIFVLLTMLVVFAAVLGVLVLRPVPKAKAATGCSNATLYGNYGLVASGWYGHFDAPYEFLPGNFSMLVSFNGRGGFTGSNLNMVINGSPEGGNPYSFTGGTYTINSNCTCTLTIPNSPTPNPWDATITVYGIAVDTGGDEVAGNLFSSNPNITGTFDAKRVAIGLWANFR
jgi:hypothetical protein